MFEFNGQEKDYIHSIQDIKTHYGPNREIEREGIPGGRGARLRHITDGEKVFELDITVLPKNGETFQEVADDMVRWLYHDEPKPLELPDNPGRYYDVLLEGGIDRDEIIYFAKCTLTFVCLDGTSYTTTPYENTAISDVVDVVNEGTAETDFTVEATALEDSTMFMITKGDEDYFMIGESETAYDEAVETNNVLLREYSWNNLVTWTQVPDGTIVGQGYSESESSGDFTVENQFLKTDFWGSTPGGWYGPVMRKSMDETVSDYDATIAINLGWGAQNKGSGKAFMHLKDESQNIVATIGVYDPSKNQHNKRIYVAIHNTLGETQTLVNWNNRNYNSGLVFLRLRKKGDNYIVNAWQMEEWPNRTSKNEYATTYTDKEGKYSHDIRLAEILISRNLSVGNTLDPRIAMVDIKRNGTAGEGEIPFIISAGDVVRVDTRTNFVSINDTPATTFKDFGSNYFKLDRGLNRLAIEPVGKFDTTVTWYDRYL